MKRWNESEKKPDLILLLATLLLLTIGTVMIYSSSSILAMERFRDGQFFLKKQLFFVCLGLGIMVFATRIPHYKLRKLAWPGIILSAFFLLLIWIPIWESAPEAPTGGSTSESSPSRFPKWSRSP